MTDPVRAATEAALYEATTHTVLPNIAVVGLSRDFLHALHDAGFAVAATPPSATEPAGLRESWKRAAKLWRERARSARDEKYRVLAAIDKAGVNVRIATRRPDLEASPEPVEGPRPGSTIELCARADCRWQVGGPHYPHGMDDFGAAIEAASVPWSTPPASTPSDADLRAALRPFADYADPRNAIPETLVITQGSGLARRQLTMGDCYAARAALAATEGSET